MAKPKSKHLNIQLSDNEMDLLEQFTKGIYGAKNLLIRTLLRRFFKEQKLYEQKKEIVCDTQNNFTRTPDTK